MERLQQKLEFIMEIDRLKTIVRQSYITDGSRKETDTDHSWHLAMMAVVLKEYSNQEIDVLKTVTMVLIHDIVEIDAGDTYAYDEGGNGTKREREVKAANRIFGLLPENQKQEFLDLWEEFEAGETPESRFANTLDKVQPILLNDATNGRAWREHGVREEQVLKRNTYTKDGSMALWLTVKELIEKNVEAGNIKRGETDEL